MKKIGIVLAIVVALALVGGCASSGGSSESGGGAGGGDLKPFSVDLSTLSYRVFSNTGNSLITSAAKGVKNATPLPTQWDGVLFLFDNFPVDVTKYKRVTINAKYYDSTGAEIKQADGKAMVVVVYDINGDLKGPELGAGKNTPLKEFNLGGFSGIVSTDKGSRLTLNKAPGGVLLQAADPGVKFIEITQFTIHNGSASGQ